MFLNSENIFKNVPKKVLFAGLKNKYVCKSGKRDVLAVNY